MNKEQQKNLNEIWKRLKNDEFDSVGPIRPTIDQDDEDAQAMILPLETPPGGNIRVTRQSMDEDWRLA